MKLKLSLLLFLATTLAYAQVGGDMVYSFLGVPTSARAAGLGGVPVSLSDNDFNLATQNPALLSDTMDLSLVLNFSPYLTGTKNSYFAFAKSWKGVGNFAIGLNYLNYGEFDGYDETGLQQGTFTGSDMAVYLQYARKLSPHFSGGLTIKPIFSHLEGYTSNALATDIAFNFNTLDHLTSVGVVLQNYGRQFSNYDNSSLNTFTPNLSVCVSQKFAHAPVRLLLTFQKLNTWDLTYELKNTQTGATLNSDNANFLRHVVIGVEFTPSRNLYIDFSFNGQKRYELTYAERTSIVGFAGGFGFRVKQFKFGYAVGFYHLSSVAHFFSLTTNLGQFGLSRSKSVSQ